MPSPRRPGSPSMRYSGVGCTTDRADHGAPGLSGIAAITCTECAASLQNGQGHSDRGASTGSSPVMTHERVIGSLRSSTGKGEHLPGTRVNLIYRENTSCANFLPSPSREPAKRREEMGICLCYNPPL